MPLKIEFPCLPLTIGVVQGIRTKQNCSIGIYLLENDCTVYHVLLVCDCLIYHIYVVAKMNIACKRKTSNRICITYQFIRCLVQVICEKLLFYPYSDEVSLGLQMCH